MSNSKIKKKRIMNIGLLYLLKENLLEEEIILSRKPKTWWVSPILQNRNIMGSEALVSEMRLTDHHNFKLYHRMSVANFDNLLSIVGPSLQKMHFIREPIRPELRLRIILRYLATGESRQDAEFEHLVGRTTIGKIINEGCQIIWELLGPQVFCPDIFQNPEYWKQVAERFEVKWNFPNCIGAIDGKHVVTQALPNCGSTMLNYKGTHSLVLMAVCDADYRFTYVDIGAPGRRSDGGIFKESDLGKKLYSKTLPVPQPRDLTTKHRKMPFVFVADEAFQLMENLMRPFPGRQGLNITQRVFNYRLSRARRIIENSFGILSGVWRVYKKPILGSECTIKNVIKATICLHNFLLNQKNETYLVNSYKDMELPNGELIKGLWRLDHDSFGKFCTRINTSSKSSIIIRNNFADYFMTDGALSFQLNRI